METELGTGSGAGAEQGRVRPQPGGQSEVLREISLSVDRDRFQNMHWMGTFDEYLKVVQQNPRVAASAFQRIYNMIMAAGFSEYEQNGERLVHYKFFDDVEGGGRDAVFGMDRSIMELVKLFEAGAMGLNIDRRIILLQGPVGSSKSTLVRQIKQGLERYSMTEEGALYTFGFMKSLEKPADWPAGQEWDPRHQSNIEWAPMHEDPLCLIPALAPEGRVGVILGSLNAGRTPGTPAIKIHGGLAPTSRFWLGDLLTQYDGDVSKVLEHVVVKRILFSEADRVGIGTFQPKDEKSQDATELTGDINFRKIAQFGRDSDPRAFNFDGELCVANRGLCEFVELLKLSTELLYDLLGASQEKLIKPKKFPQTPIDEVLIGHTNEPEYEKLRHNKFMEAIRDRTVTVRVPYITRLSDEVRIYEKDFNAERLGKHVAPHTLEVVAMFAVLTRLEDPKKADLSLMDKLMLYDGREVTGYSEDTVTELRKAAQREGHDGISPRFIQDTLSECLVDPEARQGISPFMLLPKLKERLPRNPHINSPELIKRYEGLIDMVWRRYEEIIKAEVQEAIAADEEALKRLGENYVSNVKAYIQRKKVTNPFTREKEDPDERLMRSIEAKMGITEPRKDDFRRELMSMIGAASVDGKSFDFMDNERLLSALRQKLFDDRKDQINLRSYVSAGADRETQEKIDIVKQRLISSFGYDEQSASDVLRYVASIFARGSSGDK